MVNPFTNINIILDYVNGHKIHWSLTPFFNAPAPYKFTLLAYQDMNVAEPVYTIDAGENFYVIDNTNTRQNVLESFLYKVVLTDGKGATYVSNFSNWNPNIPVIRHRYLNASEIIRKENVRLTAGVGLPGYLLKRRYYSQTTPQEVDVVTGEPVIDSSKGSFGIGQENGYYPPVLFLYSLEGKETDLSLKEDGTGTSYQEVIAIRTVGFPYFESHDIVIAKNGKRYMVVKNNQTSYPGTDIYIVQIINLQIISPTDTIYKYNVPEFTI